MVPRIHFGFGSEVVEEFVGTHVSPATSSIEGFPKRCYSHDGGDDNVEGCCSGDVGVLVCSFEE